VTSNLKRVDVHVSFTMSSAECTCSSSSCNVDEHLKSWDELKGKGLLKMIPSNKCSA